MPLKYYVSLFTLFLLISIQSCKDRSTRLTSQTIFTVPIGLLRDELNLLLHKNVSYNNSSNFTMTPLGSYYISDQAARKILHYNNNGRLNYIIYNPKYRFDSDKNSSKYLDKKWDFGEIYGLAASLDRLYVASSLHGARDAGREAWGENSGDHPDSGLADVSDHTDGQEQVILTFNNKGDFLYSLGGEGKGRSAFQGQIIQLFIDSREGLLVLSKKKSGFQIYQFSPQGEILRSFELSVAETISVDPNLKQQIQESTGFFTITSPYFSYDGKKLYFELYRYTSKINNTTLKTREVNAFSYDIYHIDMGNPSNSLAKDFSVRDFRAVDSAAEQVYGESLIGSTEGGMLVFLQTYPSGKNVVVYYDSKGNQKYAVTIDVDLKVPYKLYVAPNGLISALNFYEDHVSIVWWRTDKLLQKEFSF